MQRADVTGWVERYERAWAEHDTAAAAQLFTEDARYLHSPYAEPLIGHDAILADWVDEEPFTMTAEIVAVDGDLAVVRVLVRYLPPAGQEYRDLWLLRFAPDGRVREFEEWAYWPGLPYSAEAWRADQASPS
ncbi:MAG TPA: nuclear transport factor 2 family protein [Candidatus Nanopelagicales bacterium]|jgi:ketosteroid isomerase-like protein|nr:nuclear transport factor 2 family protein [Candidatus Nanopelagicales bacterium]